MDKAEKIGLSVAAAGHVLLFGLLSSTLLKPPVPLKLNSPPMDITMVDEVALRSTAPKISTTPPPTSEAPEKGPAEEAAPSKPAPPEPKPTPPEPPVKVTPAPPPPKPVPATRPVERAKPKPAPPPKAPAPRPAPPKPAPPKPAPAKAAPAKPTPAPAKAKPAPTRTPLKLALDRPDSSGQGKAAQSRGSRLGPNFLKGIDSDTPTRNASPAPAASAVGPAQKAALDAEIRRQIKPYWKAPTGADAEQLRTIVQVDLNKDGSIADGPTVVQTSGTTDANRAQVKLHQELAVKAIKLAAPFRLPPDLYDGWKSLRIAFDKRLSQ